jgi:hypothetical protein
MPTPCEAIEAIGARSTVLTSTTERAVTTQLAWHSPCEAPTSGDDALSYWVGSRL